LENQTRSQVLEESEVKLGPSLVSDPDALNLLFASCLPQLRKTALRMMDNKEDSEDAVQNAMLQAFRNIRSFRGCAKFSTWMHSILLNSARSLHRKNRRVALTHSFDRFLLEGEGSWTPNSPQALQTSPEEACMEGERERIIEILVQELPAAYREAVWLREVEGFKIREIAARLGIGMAAAKARVHRGRHLIQRCMRAREVSIIRRCGTAYRPQRIWNDRAVRANSCIRR